MCYCSEYSVSLGVQYLRYNRTTLVEEGMVMVPATPRRGADYIYAPDVQLKIKEAGKMQVMLQNSLLHLTNTLSPIIHSDKHLTPVDRWHQVKLSYNGLIS
jgi:hypothetical protein